MASREAARNWYRLSLMLNPVAKMAMPKAVAPIATKVRVGRRSRLRRAQEPVRGPRFGATIRASVKASRMEIRPALARVGKAKRKGRTRAPSRGISRFPRYAVGSKAEGQGEEGDGRGIDRDKGRQDKEERA